jgi:hypothetical protein
MGIAASTFLIIVIISLGCFFVTESTHFKKVLPAYFIITAIITLLYIFIGIIKH